ncbi:axonemal dynein light chain domain-containing protein 1 isoform X2 [Anabas testudineus]|uniref:axonemal dynein light chain domain-containing protein 1 isoform X2 n=1 Tax=Anabas testudineus TaxID=64144 RepID=UPI000E459EAD|nr:axonemal dynein light chain domain-containing protein 1 isoform X2 [Anabas testudineus]
MSGTLRASSAPSSSRQETTRAEINYEVPVESRRTEHPPVNDHVIPDELLVSLTSTVCNRSTLGHTAHHRHCKGCGIRRPDAVWHHPFGRKKYKYFLEQPTSLSGAGRDISFLCDAMVTQTRMVPLPPLTDKRINSDIQNLTVSESLIPEEYHIVKNKGLRSLEFYEDAFTVQLQDDEQNLRVFPSLRPSGRLEVVQLMKMMDDMLEKAGVDRQSEELTGLSQMEGLLELVQVEQNIYNIVFHELIRQVSVGCAERGQLLAKLRQRYQLLLERIPGRLKALHTETVAQRALDRRLTEEIHRIKTSIQQLSTELSKIRDHDAFVSQQAENAHEQLAEALKESHMNSGVVQGYHELYELQRGRLETQLLQLIEERDCWSQLTFCLALKVISVKKLKVVSRLHVCEQSWFKTAEHCILYITSKDTEDLNIIMDLTDYWREQLTALMSQLKKTEHAQSEQISAIKQGIAKWLTVCTTQSKCPDPKYEKTSLEKIYADLKHWSHCDRYQGEILFNGHQTLGELAGVQERWLNMSLQLLRRHSSPDGELPGGQQVLRELDRVLPELFIQLDTQVSGENEIHKQIMSLHSLMESEVSNLGPVVGRQEITSASDWLKLEKVLHNWQRAAEEAFNISRMQTENEKDKSKNDIYKETVSVLDKVQEFITNLSNFTNGENHRLSEEVSSIHITQTRWMLDLLLIMVPDHSEDQNPEQEHYCTTHVSLQTLDEDAKMLAEKLDYFSKYITSCYKFILEEHIMQNLHQAEGENEQNECRKLQMECIDWVETTTILLSQVKVGPSELTARSNVPVSPANSMDTVNSTEQREAQQEVCQVELAVCEKPVLKLVGYDGNITERVLGESTVHLYGTDEHVVSPATDEARKALSELTTVGILQQKLHDSELRVQSAEQRALKAEEALQAALEKIQDLEIKLQGRSSLEPKISDETKKTPPPSSPPVTLPQPPPSTKITPETKPKSSTRKTKKH